VFSKRKGQQDEGILDHHEWNIFGKDIILHKDRKRGLEVFLLITLYCLSSALYQWRVAIALKFIVIQHPGAGVSFRHGLIPLYSST